MYKEPNFHNFDEILVIGKTNLTLTGFQTFCIAKDDEIFFYHIHKWKYRNPKVSLTHKNIVSHNYDINSLINLSKEEIIIICLPLAHIFERTVMSYYLSRGISIYFVDDIQNVANL